LDGSETYEISGIKTIKPFGELTVNVQKKNGDNTSFNVIVRLDSLVDIEYYKNGGILHTGLRNMLKNI